MLKLNMNASNSVSLTLNHINNGRKLIVLFEKAPIYATAAGCEPINAFLIVRCRHAVIGQYRSVFGHSLVNPPLAGE